MVYCIVVREDGQYNFSFGVSGISFRDSYFINIYKYFIGIEKVCSAFEIESSVNIFWMQKKIKRIQIYS